MPEGGSYHFDDQESGNLTAVNVNSLDQGGNVYMEGAGSLNVNVTGVRVLTSGGEQVFGGAAGVAIPASSLNVAVYVTVPGNVLTVNAGGFPGGEHLPLAEVDTSATEVIAIRDRRYRQTTSTAAGGTGDVTGPAGATADAVALYDGPTGKLLKDGPTPGAANGLATLDGAGQVPGSQLPAFGDVVGPAGATADAVPLFDGATGKLLKDGPTPGAANGLATLDGAGLVPAGQLPPLGTGDVVGPAGATPGAVALYDGATGKLLQDGPTPGGVNGLATLNASSLVVQEPAAASITPLANRIPKALGTGRIDAGWLPAGVNVVDTFLAATDYNSNLGDRRTRSIGGGGSHRFSFAVPLNYVAPLVIQLIGICSAGAAGAGKDIDLSSEFAALGELRTTNTQVDAATLYDFTGQADRLIAIDLTPVLVGLAAGDYVGILVDHNGIGGSIDYLGIRFSYQKG